MNPRAFFRPDIASPSSELHVKFWFSGMFLWEHHGNQGGSPSELAQGKLEEWMTALAAASSLMAWLFIPGQA